MIKCVSLGALSVFRSVHQVTVDTLHMSPVNCLTYDAAFFRGIAEHGVAEVDFTMKCPDETSSAALFPWLFAEPLIDRSLFGARIVLEDGFVSKVHKVRNVFQMSDVGGSPTLY